MAKAKTKSATPGIATQATAVGATPAVNDEKAKRVPETAVPEVADMLRVWRRIEQLKAQHPEVFAEFSDLVEQYNAALELAEKAVRVREVSCGPFDNYSVAVKIDPTKMYEELGEELFLRHGGKTSQVMSYSIDAETVRAAIAKGSIPKDCVNQFVKIQRNYHKPDKLAAP